MRKRDRLRTGGWRAATAWAGLAAGLGLLGLAALLLFATMPRPVDTGTVPHGGPSAVGHRALPVNGGSQRQQLPSGKPAGALSDTETGPPTRLQVPALGIDAPIVPVYRTDGGNLAVPANPRILGWWAQGAVPGAPEGTAVIDGHVDSATSGTGALFRLRSLRPGARVKVTGSLGSLYYTVAALRQYPKSKFPARQAFAQHVNGRLVIITCGGLFDQAALSYLDNIVVYAVPASRAS